MFILLLFGVLHFILVLCEYVYMFVYWGLLSASLALGSMRLEPRSKENKGESGPACHWISCSGLHIEYICTRVCTGLARISLTPQVQQASCHYLHSFFQMWQPSHWDSELRNPFRLPFFHLVNYTLASSVSFHGWILHHSPNTPHFTHLMVLTVMNKVAIWVQVSVWACFFFFNCFG